MAYVPNSTQSGDEYSRDPAPGIFIHDDTHPRAAVVCVFGEATFADSAELETMIVGTIRIGRPVIIDLRECSYMDCAAVGVIVRSAKKLRDLLRLVVPHGRQSYRMLEIVGLTRVLNIYETLDEAIAPPDTSPVATLRSV